MVLSQFFRRPSVLDRHCSSTAGPYLDDFASWLDGHGFAKDTIRRRIRGAIRLVEWAAKRGISVARLGSETLEDFERHLAEKGHVRKRGGHYPDLLAAKQFVEFLCHRGVLDRPFLPKPKSDLSPIVTDFCRWMRNHRGVAQSTLDSYYCRAITGFLKSLGKRTQLIEARALRAYVSDVASRYGTGWTKNVVTALRMFVRFLVVEGKCAPGLEDAIPTIAEWRLSSLPRYLPTEEVERLIAACDPSTVIGARDRAIMLLLARLGLRASEVARMSLGDINWDEGTLVVAGKSRREVRLPLTQEIGDAILHYLRHSRPQVDTGKIFIRVLAPRRGLSRASVSYVVANAIQRVGLKAPHQGAHLLRHSAATTMLREGMSLQEIGGVLRHKSIATTAHYAKVDIGLLKLVTMPWPGVKSC